MQHFYGIIDSKMHWSRKSILQIDDDYDCVAKNSIVISLTKPLDFRLPDHESRSRQAATQTIEQFIIIQYDATK